MVHQVRKRLQNCSNATSISNLYMVNMLGLIQVEIKHMSKFKAGSLKALFPFSREYIKVTNVIEYVCRSTLNMTNLNTVYKEGRSRLYHISGKDLIRQLQQVGN